MEPRVSQRCQHRGVGVLFIISIVLLLFYLFTYLFILKFYFKQFFKISQFRISNLLSNSENSNIHINLFNHYYFVYLF